MIFQLLQNDIYGWRLRASMLMVWGSMLGSFCHGECFSSDSCRSNLLFSAGEPSTQEDGLGLVSMELINGKTIESSIKTVGAGGLVNGDATPPKLNIRQVLSIKTARKFASNSREKMRLEFVGGGDLWIDSVSMSDEKIKSVSSLGSREFPLELLRAIVWSSSPLVDRKIKAPSADLDTVVVNASSGERIVEGILESVDLEFVRIKYKGESKKIGLSKVKAIITADLGLEKPKGPVATIQLIDRSQIRGEIRNLEDGVLEVGITSEDFIRVPAGIVVAIAIKSDRLRYLSDQDPIEVQEKSIFALQRHWKKNLSVAGNPLEIRLKDSEEIRSFKKGVGMQASSRLVFANDGGFDRFSAVAGIAAETKGRGDCQMIVRGDGIELWSERVTGEGGPLEIDVDIEGIREVVLVVSPGAEFDLGDHANWGEARFLKMK
jgi:hypothetical protein